MAVAVFAGVWGILYVLLSSLGSGYLVLDNTVSVIGVASNVASLLYLIEFPYVQCLSLVLNIVLYMQMVQTDPMQWTFLIYTVYALICALISAVYMQKLYNWQRKEKLE